MDEWKEEKILILLRTTPRKSGKYKKVTCTAGVILNTLEWRRLWRVPPYLNIHRWDIIKVKTQKSNDKRKETYFIKPQSVKVINQLSKKDRINFLENIKEDSLEILKENGLSLGIIKPKILKVKLTKDNFIKYTFTCNDKCKHVMKCNDWGVNILCRKYKNKKDGEQKVMEKLDEYMKKNLAYFGVGTHQRWDKWLLIGLLWFKLPIQKNNLNKFLYGEIKQ